MKRLLLLFAFIVTFVALNAQGVDVTKITADTKTYLFNDGKNTVRNYIYDRLQAQTSCCGTDRIYLEVKVDPSGYVISAKALTGKNDCFKESVIDIVKNIKWDAADFKGPKSIYFEVKPELACEGRKNEYVKIETFNNPLLAPGGLPANYAAANTPATPAQPATSQPVVASTQPVASTTPAPVVTTTPTVTSTQPATGTANIPVNMSATPTKTSPNPVQTAPAATAGTGNQQVPASPSKAGPTPTQVDPSKARETAEEVAALRAEMDKRMKEEESKRGVEVKTEAPSGAKPEDKKDGKEAGTEWGMDTQTKDCIPVVGKDGKPLVDKFGKQVMNCNTKTAPKEEKLSPEQLAEKKKQEEEAKKLKDEQDRLAKMTPAERKRFDEEKARKADEERQREVEKKATDRIAEAERKIRDAKAAKQKAEDDAKRQELEMQRAEEDLARAKKEAQTQKDQAELARIENEKRALEEKKREQELQVKQKMDEIARIQQDMERLTGDLQRQQEELRKVEEKQVKFKEEMTARASGEVIINNNPSTASAPVKTSPAPVKPSTPEDTSAVNKLMQQIEMMREQIRRMQQEMEATRANRSLSGALPTAPSSTNWATTQPQVMPVPASPKLSENTSRGAVEAQSAALNREWEKIDYNNTESLSKTETGRKVIMADMAAGKPVDSKETKQQKVVLIERPVSTGPTKVDGKLVPPPAPTKVTVINTPAATTTTPPATNPVPAAPSATDRSPDASHTGSFANVPVNAPGAPEYIDGEQGMKNYLSTELKKQGVCGLAHIFSEVNIDRNGNVTSYKVVKSTPETITAKLPSVILGMKFKTNPQTAPYTQTVYVEFKGDIRCEGKPGEKVNIKNVENFIKVDK
ncbi:MAG: hypothetical protein K1X92_16995 [Bacteroidia bacterium]|nr:hypothetical protein [Bacteroidia bacterium]